jgi:hypothetical protein
MLHAAAEDNPKDSFMWDLLPQLSYNAQNSLASTLRRCLQEE